MVFAHDTEVALAMAAALVNSMGRRPGHAADGLEDLASLDAFLERWWFTGSRAGDGEQRDELEDVRSLRPVVRRLWLAQDPAAVANEVNRLLAHARALPQLVQHDGWDWHLHATAPEQPLPVRLSVDVAMALLDVVRSGELDRLEVCQGQDCDDLFVDLSRNRSRRYCEGGCGNRANVAAYRARRATRGA